MDDRQSEKQTGKQTNRQAEGQAEGQANRETEARQANGKTEGQIDSQKNRQMEGQMVGPAKTTDQQMESNRGEDASKGDGMSVKGRSSKRNDLQVFYWRDLGKWQVSGRWRAQRLRVHVLTPTAAQAARTPMLTQPGSVRKVT